MSKRGSCISTCRNRSWRGGARPGLRWSQRCAAAIRGFTSTMCCRRIVAPISIFSSAAVAMPSRAKAIEVCVTKFKPDDFHGTHAILYALFDENERLGRAAMRRQVEICLATGVHGMAALGLATEVAKLTEAERRTIMDWTAEDTAG